MNGLYEDNRAPFAYDDASLFPEPSSTSLSSGLLALLAGAYVVFKALELLGYPVWLWLHMASEKIGTLRLRGMESTSDDTTSTQSTQNAEMQRGGNVLGSVFGLNGSSLLHKGVKGVTGALSRPTGDVPPGLGNWDNSCYQNSVIQGLASLPSVRDYLSKTTTEYRTLDAETTNGALFDMISKLNDPDNHGQHFWIRGKLKSMSTFQQQDAQEYYSKVLDALDKEVQNAANSKRRSTASWLMAAKSLSRLSAASVGNGESPATEGADEEAQTPSEQPKITPNPLDGLLAQRVGCIHCGYSEGLQLIPFNCVTVSLGRSFAYDIRECLDEYTHLEYIEGVECAKCTLLKMKATLSPMATPGSPYESRLQAVQQALDDEDFDDKTLIKDIKALKKNWVKSTKSRQAVIARAPKALVLHVNRSIFDEMTGAQYKNTAGVSYPRVLDLGNWCLGNRPSESHMPDEAEEWPRDPTKSMLGDAHAEPTTTSPFQYQLQAAVTHYGSHGNGHYVCYRQHRRKSEFQSDNPSEIEESGNQWWKFSDDTVSRVSEEQAHQGNVFMLFYERVDEPTSSPPKKMETTQEAIAMEDDIVLPPAEFSYLTDAYLDDAAADVPLPDHSDVESLPDLSVSADSSIPPSPSLDPPTPAEGPATPQSAQPVKVVTSAYPTPPPDSPSISPVQETNAPSEAPQVDVETPSPDAHETTSISEVDSEYAPSTSTQLTSDDEAEDAAPSTPHPKVPPNLRIMRTAGDSPTRGEGSRRSLPMVTAT